MEIAIGLPASALDSGGALVIEWAERADAGPFSSLGIIRDAADTREDEPIALAACAAVTSRILLLMTMTLDPLSSGALPAKQAASLDALSGGRLTLGLGPCAPAEGAPGNSTPDPEERFETLLAEMHAVWRGQPLAGTGRIGPAPVQPNGPAILLRASSPSDLAPLARWGVGFIAGPCAPEEISDLREAAARMWSTAGRTGHPRIVGWTLVAPSQEGRERAAGLPMVSGEQRCGEGGSLLLSSADDFRTTLNAYGQAGVDELFLCPVSPDVEQVDTLARLVE